MGNWSEGDRIMVREAFKEYQLYGVNWNSGCKCKWTDAYYILRSAVKSGQVVLDDDVIVEEKEVSDEV